MLLSCITVTTFATNFSGGGSNSSVTSSSATYATTAGNAATVTDGVYTSANNSLSGYNVFGQVQVSSVTITGGNVVLTATAAYATAAGSAGSATTALTVANGVYTNIHNVITGPVDISSATAQNLTVNGTFVVPGTVGTISPQTSGSMITVTSSVTVNGSGNFSGDVYANGQKVPYSPMPYCVVVSSAYFLSIQGSTQPITGLIPYANGITVSSITIRGDSSTNAVVILSTGAKVAGAFVPGVGAITSAATITTAYTGVSFFTAANMSIAKNSQLYICILSVSGNVNDLIVDIWYTIN